ncbi:MAG: hypothetical protein Q8O22_05510 [Candidatus Omnitrophota bacterium]|nr:hypothetical protein [Candidatus Omnitrophota bacterium]
MDCVDDSVGAGLKPAPTGDWGTGAGACVAGSIETTGSGTVMFGTIGGSTGSDTGITGVSSGGCAGGKDTGTMFSATGSVGTGFKPVPTGGWGVITVGGGSTG